ncbi:TPA: hypothetical protein BOS_12968 [Bos taurus]|nr:TPA: hypothetical protein BOS_12968 [Bos taurus]
MKKITNYSTNFINSFNLRNCLSITWELVRKAKFSALADPPDARARARSPAGAGARQGGGSPRPGWPGARSEPLRAPGGRHPGALQLIPGARPPLRDSRARSRGRRRSLGPDPLRNSSALAAVATELRTDPLEPLAESQLAQGPVFHAPATLVTAGNSAPAAGRQVGERAG